MATLYNVNCFKCRKQYLSKDAFDKDGQGFCIECTKEKLIIARAVDEKMKKKRLIEGNVPEIRANAWVNQRGTIWFDKMGNKL